MPLTHIYHFVIRSVVFLFRFYVSGSLRYLLRKMSFKNCPPCPASLKLIQHYLKTAAEHDERDIVVAYWCRLYALQVGLKTDRSTPEAKKLLAFMMDWLEKTKAEQKDNEAIAHDIPAQAHLENYALKLFLWADSQDRTSVFNKNVVKAFYTAGMIYDVLDTFGEPTEEVQQNKKYAKWKAAYIHNCLKNGETPLPGPMADDSENLDVPSSSNDTPAPPTSGFGMPETLSYGIPPVPGFGMPTPGSPYPVPGGNGTNPPLYPPEPPTQSADPESKSEPLSPSKVLDFTNPDTISNKSSSSGVQLSPEQLTKAQKYCKWAGSALNYDDIPTAVSNLQKALKLLTTGVDE